MLFFGELEWDGCGSVATDLGEEGSPDGFDFLHVGGLDDGSKLVGLDIATVLASCFAIVPQAGSLQRERTVISTPSSARMRAAYEVASSAVDISTDYAFATRAVI